MGWRNLFGLQEDGGGAGSALAIIDAATIYGAGRWLFQVHRDPEWRFASQYDEFEDRLHFEELIHNLLLYDEIVMDHTSQTMEFAKEIDRVMDEVNKRAGRNHLYTDALAPHYLDGVSDIVCKLLAERSSDSASMQGLLQIPVPWYYRTQQHHDWQAFTHSATRHRLTVALLPLALFIYRGLCYSGFANNRRKGTNRACAYLASPGRLKALTPILSRESMSRVNYPKKAYADLVDMLGLPSQGYSFDHLDLEPAHISNLAVAMEGKSPPEVLDRIFQLRSTSQAEKIRGQWADRLWSSSQSCAVGAVSSNVISGSTIYGSVKMVVRAAA